MLFLTRPLGRLPFLAAVTGVNLVLGFAIILALTFLPSGGGHVAVLIVIGALQFLWMALHARRFADAGRGPKAPIIMFLIGLLVFVMGYLIFAALWSSPEVQREAFRTAGGIGGSALPLHVESNQLVLEAGRALSGWFGTAGAVVVSGLIAIGFGLTGLVAGAFTLFSLFLPGGQQTKVVDSDAYRFRRVS